MNCQFCGSPLAKDFTNLFTCGTSHPHRSRFRSKECELGEQIFTLTSERDALTVRVKRLEDVGGEIVCNGSVSERLYKMWLQAKEEIN